MKKQLPHQPPQWPLRFLRWIIRPEYLEEIEGDMEEVFQDILDQYSPRRARSKYAFEALKLFRFCLLKPFLSPIIHTPTTMLRHNFLITYRSFLRNKSSFFINLLGLSSGLACVLLIYLWVVDEWSMDKFHKHDAQLFQLTQKEQMPGEIVVVDWIPFPLASTLLNEVPEVINASNYKSHPALAGVINYEGQFVRANPLYADQHYLNVFTYPLIHGKKDQVLADKYAVVISEEIALKLFSTTQEAIGKTFIWEKKLGGIMDLGGNMIISGVFKNLPDNSTEQFDVIFSFDFYIEKNPEATDWENDQARTCLLLASGTDLPKLEQKIADLANSKTELERQFHLRQYSSNYLYGNYENGIQTGGRVTYVWLFSGIALLILIIASINFINLSTAKASSRLKEIGVKKTLGASRKSLIFQFVNEYLLLCLLAFLIALVFVYLFLPQFNLITGKQLALVGDPVFWLSFLLIILITSLLSGIYPAFYISGFHPVQMLKGKLLTFSSELWSRKALVVFQFAASMILIVSVLVIYRQMNFIHSKNLGFDKQHILTLKNEGALKEKTESFLHEVRNLSQIVEATNSNNRFVGNESFTRGISWEGRPDDVSFMINVFTTNYRFLETFGINLKEGRSFSLQYGTETNKVILNEAAIRDMGMQDPIGKTLNFWGKEVEIIGIVEDFHFQSLYEGTEPCIFRLFGEEDNIGDHIYIKMKAGQEVEAIEAIERLYEKFNPGYDFKYGFVDEEYLALYHSETRVAALSKYFASLAILISCLGLFGLAAFMAERRRKEISIRKILGASVWGIFKWFSLDFIKMLVIAVFIALPISYLIMSYWLENFAYQIGLHGGYFFGAAGLVLMIALLTISAQMIKAAHINPAECLRDE